MQNQIYTTLASTLESDQDAWLLTVIKGPELGAKALVYYNPELSIISKSPEQDTYWSKTVANLSFDQAHALKTTPAGDLIFLQQISLQPKLVIFGGGHISLPMAQLGKLLGFKVTVVDERPEFANSQRFNMVDKIHCLPFSDAINQINYSPDTYFVIVTRGHQYDRLCLEKILKEPFAYVGMIGSKSKIKVVMDYLRNNGYPQNLLDQVHSPIGLKIGAQSPAEIAICIAAEIIQVKNQNSKSYIDETIIQEILQLNQPAALATIISKQGSSPRQPGTMMLVLNDGRYFGTIGGGTGEKSAYDTALQVIKYSKAQLIHHDMTNKDAQTAGMVCGGTIDIFVELI